MKKEAVGEGGSVPEALDAALEELGVQQDAVDYEVVEEPGRRFLGLGGEKTARVRVWLKSEFVDEIEEAKKVARDILDVPDEVPTAEEPDEVPTAEEPGEGPTAEEPGEGPARDEISEEELDRVADEAVSAIRNVLDCFGIEASIEEYEGDEGEIILDVVGGDLAVLIGRHGKTLDALQTLVAAITTRQLGYRHPVVVDVEGYRNRRREKLEDIGRRAADRATRQGAPVKLRPMSSYERRIVHICLRDDKRVTTASEGEEPFRQVVVMPR
ncbi:MAG: Jag N-terminal domain-containing protein [Coriobacteriia bacterium]|nr:Jag N-terminal domain-containing protein [Coriobacteriia bacterium]